MRIIRSGSGFQLVETTKEEKNAVLRELEEENKALMQRCLRTAVEVSRAEGMWLDPAAVATVAAALFDKLASKAYTALCDAETAKVFYEKEAANVLAAHLGDGRGEA